MAGVWEKALHAITVRSQASSGLPLPQDQDVGGISFATTRFLYEVNKCFGRGILQIRKQRTLEVYCFTTNSLGKKGTRLRTVGLSGPSLGLKTGPEGVSSSAGVGSVSTGLARN